MNRSASRFGNSRGAVIVWVTILMVVFLAFAALAVDLGFVLVTRNELQNISDATSLAGARVLGLDYEALTYEQQQTYVADADAIYEAVEDVAGRNRAGGVDDIEINTSDITIGRWDTQTKVLTPTLDQANAVRVIARRDESANAPLQTFFARVFGEETASVSALGTAALTPQSTVGEGGLDVPFGIGSGWFNDPPFCDRPIEFYANTCVGWHSFAERAAQPPRMIAIINGLREGTYLSPETEAGDEFYFTEGTLSTHVFDAFEELYLAKRDPESLKWEVAVPVYEQATCGVGTPVNQWAPIVGFAKAVITGVEGPPNHRIDGYVICELIELGRGGGADFGTLGSIPGLVQ